MKILIVNIKIGLLIGFMLLLPAITARAQDEVKGGIISEDFAAKRPAQSRAPVTSVPNGKRAKPASGPASAGTKSKTKLNNPAKPTSGSATPGTKQKSKARYRVLRPRKKAPSSAASGSRVQKQEPAVLGITVWRLRADGKGDPSKDLIEEGSQVSSRLDAQKTERLATGTRLAPGEKIRLGIESISHSGFLYIVNREVYDGGTKGQARLIYPTLRTKNSGSFVQPGNLIFIPPAPRFFTVTPKKVSGRNTLGEEVIFVISPRELIDPDLLSEKALVMTDDQVLEWEQKWEKDFAVLDQIGGAGRSMTAAEHKAGQETGKDLVENYLTQDDELPQTLYRVLIDKGEPVLVKVLLEYRR